MNFLSNLNNLVYRILWTIGLLYLIKSGTEMTLPAINVAIWLEIDPSRNHIGFFALYITPYILTNIFIFLFFSRTSLYKKWKKVNSKKINIFIQMMTLFFSFIQASWFFYKIIKQNELFDFTLIEHDLTSTSTMGSFYIFTIFFWITGTTILQWFAHLISKKGLGNGVTLIIVLIFFLELPVSFLNTSHIGEDIIFLKEFWFFLTFILILIHVMSKKTIQNIYLSPLTGLWDKNRLRGYYKKNLVDFGGGTSQLHGFYFSFQSISFFALILSNFLHQILSFFFKDLMTIYLSIVGYYLLEFLIQLYSIWISSIIVVWFFCIVTNDLSRESINRFLYVSNQIPGHLNPRDLAQTILKKNQLKIKKIVFFYFFY
jgi:hypothetical protein